MSFIWESKIIYCSIACDRRVSRAGLETVGSERRKLKRGCLSGAGNSIAGYHHAKPGSKKHAAPQVLSSLKRTARRVRHASVASSAGELSAVAKESSKWH